ncbi:MULTISPECIES: acetoacetyl-CoA reductase [Rhizobium]|uniref:acetoacetyl-CoA reductase n=1 Tax=Rhizobium TaxID=379 RepID=UPI001C82D2AE|nr:MULTISPECIES: acetoacetyl-CoA reductase [Rhizobium]MBX4917497.1 acetoacetyl-CoA reductase [Rhizobium bangladeshense]MBY5701058.1 acetoacetyl-CoA reductase [Rhizobium leguminosarum]
MSRVALVTGGTRGIGAAISIALRNANYKVAASYSVNEGAACRFNAETSIPVFKFDVSDASSSMSGISAVEAELGLIDILVNNAGIARDGMFHKMSYEQWSAVIRTDLDSMFTCTRPVIEGMRERGFGRIIIISSINGQKGHVGQVNYCAAKAGVIGFAKALAQENANKGVTVNVIAPGYIATDMVKAIPENVLKSRILPLIPVGRLGEAEEIARCVAYLAADEAGFITGSTLSINGGQFMS